MFKYDIEYQNDNGVWVKLKHWIRPIMNKSTLDETHDETQIFLSCSPIDKPFKPFTKFIINITELNDKNEVVNLDTLYRVVIADEIKQVVFKETVDEEDNTVKGLYDHDIRLAEAAKELERYTVDNLSFTNEWNKAFKKDTINAEIVDQVLSNDFYDNSPNVLVASDYVLGRIFRYGQVYTTMSEVPKEVDINDTYLAKQLTTFSNNYRISDIDVNYSENATITIPSVESSNINEFLLYAYGLWHGIDFDGKWTDIDYYADINNFDVKIVIEYPNGLSQEVNQGDEIELTKDGKYKIKYELTRNVRLVTYKFIYENWQQSRVEKEFSQWYKGLTTYLEQSFTVNENQLSTSSKLTISNILQKLVRVTPTNFEKPSQLFTIDNETIKKYRDFDAPEMIFTNKNLWEVLREIGGIINAIPYLKINNKETWNNIAFFPLSSEEPVSDKVEEEYCNSTAYYDSENYTSHYDITVDNLINPLSEYEGLLREQGWYVGKTIRSEEVEISETSMNIETVYPFYLLRKLYFVDLSTPAKKYDLSDFVKEYSLYQTLVSNDISSGKARTLYYKQGQPNIYGLQYKVSKNDYVDAVNVVAIRNILEAAGVYNARTINLLKCRFIVEYVPLIKARIKYYKTNAPKLNIKTSMFQNQSSNAVDSRALGRKMVANIGRVGNLGYVDSLKVYSLDKIPLKGQRSADNYFVATVTTEYDQNHLLSSVQYTKDYQKISDFINIQNLQRYFEVSEKQSLHRYINTNMFYIFGDSVTEINKDKGLNQANGYPQVNYLASLLVDQGYNRKINASILKAYAYDNNDQLKLVSNLYLNSIAIATGNNISIITDYLDNYGSGYQCVPYKVTENNIETEAYMNKAVPYADIKGRIDNITIQNVTDSNINYGFNDELEENMKRLGLSLPAITALDEDNLPIGDEYLVVADEYQRYMPTVSNIGCKQNIFVDKDSREILHFNQQHHFLTNDENVVIGSAMTEYCRYIQNRDFYCKLVFLENKIDNYEFKIKEKDIINITIDPENPLTRSVKDICTKITNDNMFYILSTKNNTDKLFIQPMQAYQGIAFGLDKDAKAWAIVTDTNELIIGRNEEVVATKNGSKTTPINISVTSTY